MKTAISLPEPLFSRINAYARKRRVPRSQVFVRAVEQFLREEESREITRRLNQVHGKGPLSREDKAFVDWSMSRIAELTKDDKW